MKAIVLDPGGLCEAPLLQAFRDNGITPLPTGSAEEALRAYIKHADTEAIVFFVAGDGAFVYSTIPRFRRINPTLGFCCVFQSSLTRDEVVQDLELQGIRCLLLVDGPQEIAAQIYAGKKIAGQTRREHRVDWRLTAYLFRHDELDRKLSGSGRPVEVISLSANGAYVTSGGFVPDDQGTYLFEISFPDFIFLVKGQVVWINLANTVPGKPPGFALRFQNMTRAPQQLLKNMIEADLVDSILAERNHR